MPYTVRFEGGVFWATLSGTITSADLRALINEAAAIEAAHSPVPNRIVDLGPIEDLSINFQDLSAFARERTKHQFTNEFKSALVAPDLVHYGFARMWQTLTSHSQIRVAVFPTAAEALQWLSLPGADLPETLWEPPLPAPSPRRLR